MNSELITTVEDSQKPFPVLTRRLLLVEDNAPLRAILNIAVRGWSFVATVAGTLQQARNIVLVEKPFAVVVSDYELPDGNGLEFHDWLRREMHLDVPFLLMSGGEIHVFSAADDYEFLAKPFRLEEFRNRLEHLSNGAFPPVASYSLTPAQTAMASVYARRRPTKTK